MYSLYKYITNNSTVEYYKPMNRKLLFRKNISINLTFAALKAYNKRKSPLREATMQIHAAAPKHREMPMGSTGFIGLRFNLMQLGISLRCMELKLNEWDICFFIYSFARLARDFLLSF